MDLWCTVEKIAEDNIRLIDSGVSVDLAKCASDATEFVRDDVAAILDLAYIDTIVLPPQLRMLATIKGRELAWTRYYGSRRPERSEIDNLHQDYEKRLERLRKDIQSGYLSRRLETKQTIVPDEQEAILY